MHRLIVFITTYEHDYSMHLPSYVILIKIIQFNSFDLTVFRYLFKIYFILTLYSVSEDESEEQEDDGSGTTAPAAGPSTSAAATSAAVESTSGASAGPSRSKALSESDV